MRVVIFLALVLCASASIPQLVKFGKTIQKFNEGTYKLQSFKTQACDANAAIAEVAKDADLLGCILSVPDVTGMPPNCMAPNQASYADWCPDCGTSIARAVNVISGFGCTFADVNMPDCTQDADCDAGMMCSMMGNCGAWCNATMSCNSCTMGCVNEVCTDYGSPMADLDNDVLAYNGLVMCSKNADGNYCQALSNGMDMPTCTDLEGAKCCAGLLITTSLNCNDPDAMTEAYFNQLKTNCTMVDFTATCGLPAPADCCGAKICTGGGAAFGLAPAMITALALLVKFLY